MRTGRGHVEILVCKFRRVRRSSSPYRESEAGVGQPAARQGMGSPQRKTMSMYMVGDMREKSYPEQKRPKSREKWMKVLRLSGR